MAAIAPGWRTGGKSRAINAKLLPRFIRPNHMTDEREDKRL